MSFIFSSNKEKIIAIFDIGSGSVGGALVKIPNDKTKLPTIIKSTRTDIITRKELDFELFLNDMILALGFASKALYNSKVSAPDEIMCVLASPWYTSETRLIKMSKEHSFTFTKKIVNELLNKEIDSLNSLYNKKYENLGGVPEIIEHPIVGIELNGYQVDSPLGKRTRSVEINMIISLSPKICLDKIRETISKSFHSEHISFSSFMTSYFLSVRDRFLGHDSYLLFDIGGEVTDIGIVEKGILKDSISFPYGRKSLYREISNNLKIELRDSYELFSLFTKNALAPKQKEKLLPVIESIKKTWFKLFIDSIKELPRTLVLPDVMFIIADSDIIEFYLDIIKNSEYEKILILNDNFSIVSLNGPEFLSMCNVKDGLCDPFIMIESISAMRKIELYE